MADTTLESDCPTVCSPRLQALVNGLAGGDDRALDEFWREVTAAGTPMIEPWDDDSELVTFLWRGPAESTRTWWGVDLELAQIPGTDLWYGSEVMPADLRTIYCFHHDDGDGQPPDASGTGLSHLDADNHTPLLFPAEPGDPSGRDSWLSILELSSAPADLWSHPGPGVAPGRLTHVPLLGGTRSVAVHQPAGLSTTSLPAMVVFDGYLSREVLRVTTTVDNLVAARRVPPMVLLFVDNRDSIRERELAPASPITEFVIRDLMPWAQENLGTAVEGNIVAGSSRGGLVAADIALRAPGIFGAVISQSGSFWWPRPDEGESAWLIREVARRPQVDVRWYLDVGSREDMPGPGGSSSQVDVNRQMRDALRAKGYSVHYAEYTGAHDYVNWRRTFADGLVAVCGR